VDATRAVADLVTFNEVAGAPTRQFQSTWGPGSDGSLHRARAVAAASDADAVARTAVLKTALERHRRDMVHGILKRTSHEDAAAASFSLAANVAAMRRGGRSSVAAVWSDLQSRTTPATQSGATTTAHMLSQQRLEAADGEDAIELALRVAEAKVATLKEAKAKRDREAAARAGVRRARVEEAIATSSLHLDATLADEREKRIDAIVREDKATETRAAQSSRTRTRWPRLRAE
jgi:multidrug efflux pump subunit AcrB